MSRKRSKAKKVPVFGLADGPDKKGRFSVPLPKGEKRLFFYGGVPGESVVVRRGKRGRRGEQGDLLEVVAPAATRREPPCLHFGVCGGCTLQHLPESTALHFKTRPHYQMLRTHFPQAEIFPPMSSPESFAYRTKVELTFLRDRNGFTSLGFHRRGRFDRGVNIHKCWLSPLPSTLLKRLRAWLEKYDLCGWDPRANEGDLRYLLYRHASCSNQDLAALVIRGDLAMSEQMTQDLVTAFSESGVSGALLLRQSAVSGAVVPDSCEALYGPQLLQEKVGELSYELAWNSFFQVNPRAYEKLLATMAAWRQTPQGGRILDLFCGVGSIGMSLYRPGDRLLGVELVEQAVLDAKANAQRNSIPAQFEQRSAEDWQQLDTDLLILDPPRSGCHPKLLKLLQKEAPAEELFYVSCNPHRLAEEMEFLSAHYRLVRAQAFDFFPQTHHSELLLQFLRKNV